MNLNFEKTMENCREFVMNNPNAVSAFENLDESNYHGFQYLNWNAHSVRLRVEDRICYLILEVLPGITVRGEYVPLVADYCQRVSNKPELGYLAVDPELGSVYYRMETSFRDNPVTKELLHQMERTAIAMLDKHGPALERIAYGRFPDLEDLNKEPDQDFFDEAVEQELLDRNIAEIRSHLAHANHNVVAESLRPEGARFYLESVTGDTRYHEFVHILKSGWMIRTIRLDVKCGKAYQTQLSQVLNEASRDKKVGFLRMDEAGYPCWTATTYLPGENLISKRTLNDMYFIGSIILKLTEEKILAAGHGVLPVKETSEEDVMHNLVKNALMGRMKDRFRTGGDDPFDWGDGLGDLDMDEEMAFDEDAMMDVPDEEDSKDGILRS